MHILCLLIQIYWIICIVRIIFSFIPDIGEGGNGMVSAAQTISYTLTEPVFGTVRKAMPRLGDLPIDPSPIVVFLALGLLRQLIC